MSVDSIVVEPYLTDRQVFRFGGCLPAFDLRLQDKFGNNVPVAQKVFVIISAKGLTVQNTHMDDPLAVFEVSNERKYCHDFYFAFH